MCHYVSFLVDKAGALYFGNLSRHEGIEAGHGLKPGEYREAEWVDDDPKHLTVRVEDGEDENYYRAMILAEYPDRQSMLAKEIVGKTDYAVLYYKNGKRHRDDGPAVERADGAKEWYKNGERHRDDGPAVERANGPKEWWKNGELVKETLG